MARPEVSVILPTRERAATFEHCLRTVTDQRAANLEIIVSDNASTDGTQAIARANGDPRIRYLNPGRRLSMTANWEYALSHARGDWVGILGDDDGLLPGGIEAMLALAGETGTGLVRCRPCDYLWPSLTGNADGRLVIPTVHRTLVEESRAALDRLTAGLLHYTRLPTLYSGGFVRRDRVEAARGPDGRFFRSQIPDVYSVVRLAAAGGLFAYTTRPYAINGISSHSTGIAVFARAGDAARAAPAQKFASEENLPLHPSVPASATGGPPPSIQALVYESYRQVQALLPDLPQLDPAAQLALMVETGTMDAQTTERWARRFAEVNSLAHVPRAPRVRLRATWQRWAPRVRMDRIVIADPDRPQVRDVHAAAQIAAAALAGKPPALPVVLANQARFAALILRSRLGIA